MKSKMRDSIVDSLNSAVLSPPGDPGIVSTKLQDSVQNGV